eukprot:scaffold4907_cov122-Isochrysis_galbana.AAC.5
MVQRAYQAPTKAKQAHAPEIFAIPAEDFREDKKSSQYLPSWDFRLFHPKDANSIDVAAMSDDGEGHQGEPRDPDPGPAGRDG